MNDDEIRARLRALGEEPIDQQTRAAHQRLMAVAGAGNEQVRRGFVWVGIASAAVVGFLAGSTGLAMADALPNPAQDVAHDVLRVVQVDVPEGKEGKRGRCMAEAAKIRDKDEKRAAMDACPKGGGDEEDGDENGQAPGGPPPADDPCHGRPPWAGPMSKEQRVAAKESASRADCPQDDEDAGDESGEAPGGPPPADDPCHGRPPWAGPMSKEQRAAAKTSASRASCPEDEDDAENATATAGTSTSVAPVTSESAPAAPTTVPDEPASSAPTTTTP